MNQVVSRRTMLKGLGVMAFGAGLGGVGIRAASAQGSLTEVNGGVATGPAQSLVWRVVRDTAQPAGTGETLERALGFLIANRADLLITSGDTSTYLDKGNNYFVPEADFERQESATDFPVSYVRFGLVDPAEATFTAGGDLVFGSELQQVEGNGWLQLRFYEGRLSGTEAVALPPTAINGKVVFAERGSIAVVGVDPNGNHTGHRQDLSSGQAWVPTVAGDPPDHWEVIVAGDSDHVTFYLATAEHTGGGDPPGTGDGETQAGSAGGDPSAVGGDPGSAGSTGDGTVAVELFGCSSDVGTANASNCDTWAGKVSIELESFESGALFTLADFAPRGDGSYLFRVPFGNSIVRADVLSGNLVRPVRVNGNTVQDPTVGVNDGQPHSVVHVFFSN